MNQIKSRISDDRTVAGSFLTVESEFEGTLNFGFFDAVLLKNDEPLVWMPDPNTWTFHRDTGILTGTNKFSSRWKCFIPDWVTEGQYQISVRVYDDVKGKNPGRRTPVAEEDHTIYVLNSEHPEAIFVRRLYADFFERTPDIQGFATWFVNLQMRNASRRQVLEIGFLRSPEFRARFLHKLLTDTTISPDQLEKSVNLIMKGNMLSLIKDPQYSRTITLEKTKFIDLVIEQLKLDETAIAEFRKIYENLKDNAVILSSLIDNFLIEKYILIGTVFKDLAKEQIQEKVKEYLVTPDEAIDHFYKVG